MNRRGLETASYRRIPTDRGTCYEFHCDLSGATVCTSAPIRAATPEEELYQAWQAVGRAEFNLCHRCGRWVIDAMYNADVCECVQCSPWEDQRPMFCKHCGAKAPAEGGVCPKCQKRLYY